MHAFVLPRVGVAANRSNQAWCDMAVVLARPNLCRCTIFTSFARLHSSSAESVGYAIAFSMTVVSTITRLANDALITPVRFATSILCASISSTPAAPKRLRQRDRLDGSIGGSVCKCVSPVKIYQ